MKMISLRKSVITLIIMAIIGCVGIYFYRYSAIDYFEGPHSVADKDFDELKNRYVKFDISDSVVMNCFMEKKQEGLFGKSVTWYYYVAGIRDSDGTIKCFVCVTDAGEKEIFDKYVNSFKDRISGNESNEKFSCTKSGTLLEMNAFLELKLREFMSENASWGNAQVYYEPYYISCNEPSILDVIVFTVSLFLVLLTAFRIMFILGGVAQLGVRRKIRREFGKNALREVESDYFYSRFFNENIRIGKMYVYMFSHDSSAIVNLKDLIWVYECKQADFGAPGVKYQAEYNGIEIWDNNFDSYKISSNDRGFIECFLDYIVEQCPHTAVGYNEELKNLFLNDAPGFKSIVFDKNSGGNNV